MRRGRHRLRLRGRIAVRAEGAGAGLAAADFDQDHDERRQSGPRVRLRRHSAPGRRARAPGVHHQPHDRRASAGAARIRPAAAGIAADDPPPDERLRRSGVVLCREAVRGHQHDRRGIRTGAGDRAPVGLQVERIRQPDRRAAVRAARREPDDRLPRRFALRRRSVPPVLRARMPRTEARARADGIEERADHGAVRTHA